MEQNEAHKLRVQGNAHPDLETVAAMHRSIVGPMPTMNGLELPFPAASRVHYLPHPLQILTI